VPQHVRSKWKKTAAIARSRTLKRLIPETVRFGGRELKSKLERYGMVYLKPDSGTHGKGVMRAERFGGRYRLKSGRRVKTFTTIGELTAVLRRETRGRKYVIQRGIALLKYKGRVFDLRVMAQLTPRNKWQTTGMIGRVAAPRKIVTNYHSGGMLMPVPRLLGGHMSKSSARRTIRKLKNIGVRSGQAMRRRYPGIREVGVDVGLDKGKRMWIIEVNTRPDPYIFRKLPDPSVFRRIRRYAKAYGRK